MLMSDMSISVIVLCTVVCERSVSCADVVWRF